MKTYDNRRRRWRRVPTEFDPNRNVVTARIRHFSWWNTFLRGTSKFFEALRNHVAQTIGETVGTRASLPICSESSKRSNALPSWVSSVVVWHDPNTALPTCAQSEGDTLVFEFVNNRPYGVVIDFPQPVAWAWVDTGFSLRDIAVSGASRGSDGIFVPALSRGSVGINRGSWTEAAFVERVSGLSLLADTMEAVVTAVSAAPKPAVKRAVSRAITLGSSDCLLQALTFNPPVDQGRIDANEVASFLADSVPCAKSILLAAAKRGAFDGVRISSIEHVGDALDALKAVSAAKLGNRFAELLRDRWLGSWGYFTAYAKPPAQPAPPGSAPGPAPTAPTPAPPAPPPVVTLTVYNKVTNGSTAMREDTPAYLSTVTQNFCKRDGCAIPGTDRNTGGTYSPAVCQAFGARTTNGNDGDPSDDGNPGLFTSTRWYGVRLSNGALGYISEVWIDPAQRGGVGLPNC